MWNHWTNRTTPPYHPFKDFDSARWAWTRIEKVFPELIAAVLMPNHFHIILPKHPAEDALIKRRLGGFMAGISQREGVKNLWLTTPAPIEIPNPSKLPIQLRYVFLNPCRKRICADPLEWYWSSYRELMGASAYSTDLQKRVTLALQEPLCGFRVRFHKYVSGDPSVSVTGTPPPFASTPTTHPYIPLMEILAAASGALRVRPSTVKMKGPLRALFIHLASRHGWRHQIPMLAEICDISKHSIHETLRQEPPGGLDAAELCLGDQRLRPRFTEDTFGF